MPRMLARKCFFEAVVPEKKISHFVRFGLRQDMAEKELRVSLMVLIEASSALDRINKSSAKAREFIF